MVIRNFTKNFVEYKKKKDKENKENKKIASNLFSKGNDFYDKGNDFYEKKDNQNAIENFKEAIKNFEEAIKLNSKNASYFYNSGKAYYKLGLISNNENNYQKAIENFEEAISLEPKNPSYFNNIGEAYYKLGLISNNKDNYQKAIENFEEAISLEPNNASYFNNIGNAFSNQENYDAAFIYYYKAIELNPNYSYAFNNIGVIFGKKDLFEEAIERFNRAIELDSNYSLAIENKKLSLEILNEFFINRKTSIKSSDIDYKKYQELKNEIRIDDSIEPEYYSKFNSTLALHLSSKTNKDFQEVKKKFSSFITNLKKIPNKSLTLENLLKEAELYKRASEENVKRLVGFLTFADILGWKGIWQKQNSDNGKIKNIKKLLSIRNRLNETSLEDQSFYDVNLISDTFVIYTRNSILSNQLSKKLIEFCLEEGLLIRGATSYGECYNKDMVYVGQAVDEAASWHEKGEEIGIFYTSSAKLNIKLNDVELEKYFLINGEVITKNGKIKTYFINWYNKTTEKNFYEIMKKEIIYPEISLKYFNTENRLNEILHLEEKEKE
jgi:tetratricopeptide repeat family protein